jgi:hypothetical protein
MRQWISTKSGLPYPIAFVFLSVIPLSEVESGICCCFCPAPRHPNPVISTAASRPCLCDAKWRDPCIFGRCRCSCFSGCHSDPELAEGERTCRLPFLPLLFLNRGNETGTPRLVARCFSFGSPWPSLPAEEQGVSPWGLPLAVRAGPGQTIFLKNSPKPPCQPPKTHPNRQTPYQHWRFLSQTVGIVPPTSQL